MDLQGPLVLDAETLGSLGGAVIESEKLVLFEFDATAATQAYFPGYSGNVVAIMATAVNCAVAIGSATKFPTVLPNGATKRVLDNLVIALGSSGASVQYRTRIPFTDVESIYVKTYSAAGNVVMVWITAT